MITAAIHTTWDAMYEVVDLFSVTTIVHDEKTIWAETWILMGDRCCVLSRCLRGCFLGFWCFFFWFFFGGFFLFETNLFFFLFTFSVCSSFLIGFVFRTFIDFFRFTGVRFRTLYAFRFRNDGFGQSLVICVGKTGSCSGDTGKTGCK